MSRNSIIAKSIILSIVSIYICIDFYLGLNLDSFIVRDADFDGKKIDTQMMAEIEVETSQDQDHYCANNTLDNNETDYVLNCPCTTKIPGNITHLHLFYHVGMIKNWKEIVKDQLQTLDSCGLGTLASSLTITYTNGDKSSIEDILNMYSFVERLQNLSVIPGPTISGHQTPWELYAMNAMHDTCRKINETKKDGLTSKKVAVLYFHNKGASHYSPDWKSKLAEIWSYAHALQWRKYLEYFILERPSLCLTALSNGATSCGVELHDRPSIHYSGNFWTATCDFILKLPRLDQEIEDGNYYASEFWLDKGKWVTGKKYVGLIDLPVNFYREYITPNNYTLPGNIPMNMIDQYVAESVVEDESDQKILNNIITPFIYE